VADRVTKSGFCLLVGLWGTLRSGGGDLETSLAVTDEATEMMDFLVYAECSV